MKYFQSLPLVTQTDPYGNSIVVNNILSRAYLIPSLQNNLMLFYTYDLKEIDSPENIAYRYFNDPYRFWILFYSNGIIDPYSQWPLTNQQFDVYMFDKYKNDTANSFNISANTVTQQQVLSYVLSTTHHYEQYITTTNPVNNQGQKITIQIDQDSYNTIVESSTTISFPDGSLATKDISKQKISIFDYENKLNESKRNIKLMNKNYVPQTETQLKTLMS